MSKNIGISFDLLGSLISVHRGSGYQYGLDIARFLQQKGLDSSSINNEILEENFFRVMKAELTKDRTLWVSQGLGEAKEMPIGGLTNESVINFWNRVVDGVYDRNGEFCNHDEKVISLIKEAQQTSEWKEFISSIVNRFATPEPYCWLPNTISTLRALEYWRQTQLSNNIQCSQPAVLTNSDFRLLSVVQSMIDKENEGNEKLLQLSPLLCAANVGVGKPSPLGILKAAEASGVKLMQYWIHIGDAEEDKLAAERAGCHFLRCSHTEGPLWKELYEKLQEILSLE